MSAGPAKQRAHRADVSVPTGQIAMPAGQSMLPAVPPLSVVAGAAWADDDVHVLPGIGNVRGLNTAGGGACCMHALFGVPNSAETLCCPNPRTSMRLGLQTAYDNWLQQGQPERHFAHVLELLWRDPIHVVKPNMKNEGRGHVKVPSKYVQLR